MKTSTVRILSLVIALTFAFPAFLSAQTLKEAVEAYNAGASMLKDDPSGALVKLYEALEISLELDYDGQETQLLAQSLIPKAHQQLAMNLYRDKKLPETLDQLEKARKTSIDFNDDATLARVDKIIPQLYNQMGNAEFRQELFAEAIDHYKKAIDIKTDYTDPYWGIALSYEKMEDFDAMMDYLKKTLDVANSMNDKSKVENAQKKAKGYLLKSGDVAQKENRYAEAIDFFNKSLEFDAEDGTVYFLLAVNNAELKQWEKVIEFSALALEHANGQLDKAGIYYQMGTAYQNLKRNAEACESFSKALNGSYGPAAEYQMKEVLKCN